MSALVNLRRARAVYTMLTELPPFDRWGYPPASQVKFFVVTKPNQHAGYNSTQAGKHMIGINVDMHAHLLHFARSMAHEMVHMRQDMLGRRPVTKEEQHNREFRRMQRLICSRLGFDSETF